MDHFRCYGIVNPWAVGGSQVSVMYVELLEVIEIWKLQKPSINATEIQSRLLLEGIYTLDKQPSIKLIFDIRIDATVGWLQYSVGFLKFEAKNQSGSGLMNALIIV